MLVTETKFQNLRNIQIYNVVLSTNLLKLMKIIGLVLFPCLWRDSDRLVWRQADISKRVKIILIYKKLKKNDMLKDMKG